MKKTLFYVLAAFGLLTMINACSLDVEPAFDTPGERALETTLDVEAAVNGAYSLMQSSNALGGFYILFPDLISDKVEVVTQELAGDLNIYQRNLQGVGVSAYRNSYRAINAANEVIQAIDQDQFKDKGTAFYDSNRARLKGEALFIRGIMHFELVRVFGVQYGVTEGGLDYSMGQSGIVIRTDPSEDRESKARSTVVEVYEQIEKDLIEAASLLPEEFDASKHPTSYQGRATRDAAWGYLAKVYFQKGTLADLIKAKDAVNEAIGATPGMPLDYPLMPFSTNNDDPTPMNKTGYGIASETIFQIINRRR